ncbi:MAG: ribonuclease P protein component [Rickettsia endosymbiont of Ixodes persulcatus]|nr:ribonuclease P protein component [Rickettsia endosymbiont of Ixodes persulcatus]MCZ6903890.1 ribonuclease P protein component [Rickettsia endosymbiont of Ixodes persulcatus]MCZ6910087.1 ribonuclease P protein component [Rickettsia endosymbiont of Ixodes persulcatus]MCZ6919115.1 ribonuclease P protein component [Rickettsia endosymbiont of Ixodes persulcatus]MCZ6924857.1 ribonuclease P protein component [Rickettsia endosymbiont of Ixodes persulcatus]
MSITSLKNQKEFELINKLGKKFHEKYFILVIAKNLPKIFLESKYNVFLGIKVSKKLNKKAVVRNKIKRRIRHLIRIIVSDSKLKAIKLAMIIIPRKGFEEINCSHLNYELSKIILKNILNII